MFHLTMSQAYRESRNKYLWKAEIFLGPEGPLDRLRARTLLFYVLLGPLRKTQSFILARVSYYPGTLFLYPQTNFP